MSSESAAPRKRGVKPRFTQEEVLDAALHLIDTEPPEMFTMRRLADELGMGVMTLYGYFANKQEILEAAAAAIFDEAEAPTGVGWEERVKAAVRAIYHAVRRHPNMGAVFRSEASPNPALFRVREEILAALREGGLDEAESLRGLGVLAAYAEGFGAVRASASTARALPSRIRELQAAEFPLLHGAADTFADHTSDETFEHGLAILIAGLRL